VVLRFVLLPRRFLRFSIMDVALHSTPTSTPTTAPLRVLQYNVARLPPLRDVPLLRTLLRIGLLLLVCLVIIAVIHRPLLLALVVLLEILAIGVLMMIRVGTSMIVVVLSIGRVVTLSFAIVVTLFLVAVLRGLCFSPTLRVPTSS
jgi:hypothetical protein